jgi:NTE family protein
MPTHHILMDKLAEFGASSKLNAELPFLSCSRPKTGLRRSTFLKSHGADLGKRSTADLDVLLAEC